MRCQLRLVFVAVLVSTCVLCAPSLQAQDNSDEAKVRGLEKKWADSYKHRKIELLSSLLAEDFVITVEDGATYSKSGYISHSADPTVHVEVAELSEVKVHMHGNAAVVTGAYYEKGKQDGKSYEYHDRLTDVWVKSEAGWQVIASHYSVPVK